MDLPSQRELQLETLLRERESQIAELNDEVNLLRKHLVSQSTPSRTDAITLPPALLAVLQQHIDTKQPADVQANTSSTMTTALVQRTRVLMDENNELYDLLRIGETGKLKEEVYSLKGVISRLERALKDSHSSIASLTEELDKSYNSFLAQQKASDSYTRESRSPTTTKATLVADSPNASTNGDAKPIPTGPRAHKKPRLSDAPTGPSGDRRPPPAPASMSHSNAVPLGTSNPRGNRRERERSPRSESRARTPAKEPRMEIDLDVKKVPARPPSREGERAHRSHEPSREREGRRNRDRPRERDRQRRRDRDRDRGRREDERYKDDDIEKARDHDRDRQKRNGTHGARGAGGGGGGNTGGGGGRKGGRTSITQDDRTLRERMGF